MIKQIILKLGRTIVDFFVLFELMVLFLALVSGLTFIWLNDFEIDIKIYSTIGSLLIAIALFLISVMTKYFTYLFIDIRDNIKIIAQSK